MAVSVGVCWPWVAGGRRPNNALQLTGRRGGWPTMVEFWHWNLGAPAGHGQRGRQLSADPLGRVESIRVIRRRSAVLALLAAVATAGLGASSSELTAAELLNRIDQEGGDRVLRNLWAEQQPFDYVCAQIATGDSEWLKVASKLRSFSDAGASLSLDISMAQALPKEPAAVLTAIEHPWRLEMICGAPFIEPPAEEVRAYIEHAVTALSKPLPAPLEEKRVACLYHLHTVQKRIQSQ